MDTNSLAHTKWRCQYHIVFIPKYRQKRLYGAIRADVKEVIKTLCKYKNVEIMEGAVCIDHIHLHVSIPPKYSVAEFMSYLKGIIHFVRSNRLCLLLSFSSANRCCSLDEKAKVRLCCLTDILSSEEKTMVETFGQEVTM